MSKRRHPPDPDPTNTEVTDAPPRREFLKASAAAAGATLLSSCFGGGDGGEPSAQAGGTDVDAWTVGAAYTALLPYAGAFGSTK